jgi:hypothetical protein
LKTKFLSKEEFLASPESFLKTRLFIFSSSPQEDFEEISTKIHSLPKSLSQFWISLMSGCTLISGEAGLKALQEDYDLPKDMKLAIIFDEKKIPTEIRAWREFEYYDFARPDWSLKL